MKNLNFECTVNSPIHKVFDAFTLPLFQKLAPPLSQMDILQFDGSKKGDEVKFSMGFLSIRQFWYGMIIDDFKSEDECFFIDIGKKLPWPFTAWNHKHIFRKVSANQTKLIDELEYECSNPLFELVLIPMMIGYFHYRKYIYKKEFNV